MYKYKPMSDEELEKKVEERLSAALNEVLQLSDTAIPDALLTVLEIKVESFDWAALVIEEDYALYEDYVDSLIDDMVDF